MGSVKGVQLRIEELKVEVNKVLTNSCQGFSKAENLYVVTSALSEVLKEYTR